MAALLRRDGSSDPGEDHEPLDAVRLEREQALAELVEIHERRTDSSVRLALIVRKRRAAERRMRLAAGEGSGESETGLSQESLRERLEELEELHADAEARTVAAAEELERALPRLEHALEREQRLHERVMGRATAGDPGSLAARETLARVRGPDPSAATSEHTHLRRFTATLLRHSSTYAGGRAAVYAIGFVQALILIQYLSPGAFGKVAIITVTASLVALVLMLLFRRGSLSRTFGRHADDDDDDDFGDAEEEEDGIRSRDPRAALGTGLLLTAGAGLAAIAALTALGYAIPMDIGLPAGTSGAWLGLAGALGVLIALWEILLVLPYMGRRPGAFVATMLSRPLLAMIFCVGLVASGAGVLGVVVGQVGAAVVALLGGLVAYRRTYRLRFVRSEVAPIMRLSRARWVRTASLWVLRNGDILMLAAVAPAASVGIYRLASRLVLPISFPTGAFFQAWLPLERSPALLASDRERGRQNVRGMVVGYLVMIVAACLLLLLACVDLLRDALPAAYDGTFGLLPWLVGVALAQVFLHVAHRFGRMPNRRVVYDRTLTTAAVLSVPVTLAGALLAGAEGAAAGNIAATLGAGGFLWWRAQSGAAPIEVRWGQVGATIALAVGCVLVARGTSAALSAEPFVFDVLALLAFVALLAAFGVVPREHRRAFARVRVDLLSHRADAEVGSKVAALSPDQRATLRQALAKPRASIRADQSGPDDRSARLQLGALAALRICTGTRPRPEPLEASIARYLFGDLTFLERHHAAFELYAARVRPTEVATLERWCEDTRRALRAETDPGDQ